MGLDGVELILRIEDEFAIVIDEDEASKLRTVGDVYRLVLDKLDTAPSCLSSRAFYRTRQAIVAALGVPRAAVRPSTELAGLLPKSWRAEQWGRIASRIGLEFPRLEHPKRWKDRFLLISMALGMLPILALWWAFYGIGWIYGLGVYLFGIPALILWVLLVSRLVPRLERATPRLAIELPFDTVGELAIGIVALNDAEFEPMKKENQPPSKEAVWNRIVTIFSDQLRLNPHEIVANAPIAQHLGVD